MNELQKSRFAELDYQVNAVFHENEGILPVVVVREIAKYNPEFSKQEVQEVVANYLNGLKVFEYCERVGHLWEDDSFAGPESGYMGVSCTRCGYSEGSYLY